MNNLIKNVTTLFIAILSIMSILFCSATTFAATTPPSRCQNPPPIGGSCTTCDMISMLSSLQCKTIEYFDDMLVQAIDNWLENIKKTNTDLVLAKQNATTATNNSISHLTSFYLAGMEAKKGESSSLEEIQAEDVSGLPSENTNYVTNVFAATSENLGTAMLNVNALLGPRQYNDQQKANAQILIRHLETLSPAPDIIRISDKFMIPFSSDPNKDSSIIELKDEKQPTLPSLLGVKQKNKKVAELLKYLETKPEYRNYKVKYRAAIAARTMLLDSILKIYQERIAPPNGKSAAELAYDSATRRLTPEYYDEMSKAPPATISRESLFLLAEIHHDLYQVQQQNEHLIALQTLSNLQNAQLGSLFDSATTKAVAKLIYCWEGGQHKDEDVCKKKEPAEAAQSGQPPDITAITAGG